METVTISTRPLSVGLLLSFSEYLDEGSGIVFDDEVLQCGRIVRRIRSQENLEISRPEHCKGLIEIVDNNS